MAKATSEDTGFVAVPFRMHPRVLAALGADLVTNDVVAIIELVKNSYDAFATRVDVRFLSDPEQGNFLEIEDDGTGMTQEVIEDVWCMVATPFKAENPIATSGRKVRRVVGEKGLGRLAVARLGERLHMLTQAPGSPCLEVVVDWSELAAAQDMSACTANYRPYGSKTPFRRSGTRLRIFGLKEQWNSAMICELEEGLARLISPFSGVDQFRVTLLHPGGTGPDQVRIEAPDFLTKPPYAIRGKVDQKGGISYAYQFRPISGGSGRKEQGELTWAQVYDEIEDQGRAHFSRDRAHCGPFSFEIRAWDLTTEANDEVSQRFNLAKSDIRKVIRAHKGISVYRDDVLVLPKSDRARDWLGLDPRRISHVGDRLSTSQVIGYVSISAERNPGIRDTSDRERVAYCLEAAEFEEIMLAIVGLLENGRDRDRIKRGSFAGTPDAPLDDLFGGISASELVTEVGTLAEEGASAAEAIPLVRNLSDSLEAVRLEIQERFVYYSRLATVGTIALMLVHEIRNRTTAFGTFLEFVSDRFGSSENYGISEACRRATDAVNALERLADTFSPLASRAFRRRRRHSVLEEEIQDCLDLNDKQIAGGEIKCQVPRSETHVAVDPAELEAILLNLITNSIYWLNQTPREERKLEFRVVGIEGNKRVRVWVHDSGPGIREEDVERVFWPGVTRKPGGIGMGLTVAAELVREYGGTMLVKQPGTRGGASFAFDLPLKT